MALNLDPEAQAALDGARRAVPDGGKLDVPLLMAALVHFTTLKAQLPRLVPRFPEPRMLRASAPEDLPVDSMLQPVLRHLASATAPVTAAELLRLLADSIAGRSFLAQSGVMEKDLGSDSRPGETTAAAAAPVASGSGWKSFRERAQAIEALSSFGRMLTVGEPPHKGVVEMESALGSLIRTLSKMGRRNAVVIGQPGTGKSALIYELARRLARGDESIPARLRDLDIFELSPSFLRSGASMVGQYDERVKSLIQVLTANPRIVLFVDELHSLFSSGIHERGPFTEANESFKAALGRGEISCIGCTTTAEYRRFIEPDGALARRFGVIRIEPPTAEQAVQILSSRRPRMEAYFAPLRIPDEILRHAVGLTEDYLPGRFQPDKSIQLLDEACAFSVTQAPPLAEVSEEALWRALEDIIGHAVVKAGTLREDEVLAKLREKILGQDEVLAGIARAFVAGLGSWKRTAAPRGVFFFAGPTGVGKTETAVALAKLLGGGVKEAMVRVDCNTLHASGVDSGPVINRLLGVPPGYIGYARGQGGMLSKVRDMPESIVLFDEIEKAGPAVAQLLLQILDEGRVEDVDGNLLDFRRSFIVFTSNAGCVYDTRRTIGFDTGAAADLVTPQADLEAVKAQLRGAGFGEEFLGRVRHFFVFGGLGQEAVGRIIGKQLASLQEAAEVHGLDLEWSDEVVPYLTARWQPRFGVRHLTTILRHRISEQLSVAEAQGELQGVTRVHLRLLGPEGGGSGALPGAATRERHDDTLFINLA